MPIPKKIVNYLDDNKYKYEIVEHKVTYTAWDTAQTEKVKPQEIVKALVLKGDTNYYFLVLIPANKNLDRNKVKKVVNVYRKKQGEKAIKKIDFAKEAWMKKNLLGKVGATPPFGKMLGLDIFFDNALAKNKKIFLGSGEYTMSFLISSKEYMKKEELIKGSFSKSKK